MSKCQFLPEKPNWWDLKFPPTAERHHAALGGHSQSHILKKSGATRAECSHASSEHTTLLSIPWVQVQNHLPRSEWWLQDLNVPTMTLALYPRRSVLWPQSSCREDIRWVTAVVFENLFIYIRRPQPQPLDDIISYQVRLPRTHESLHFKTTDCDSDHDAWRITRDLSSSGAKESAEII